MLIASEYSIRPGKMTPNSWVFSSDKIMLLSCNQPWVNSVHLTQDRSIAFHLVDTADGFASSHRTAGCCLSSRSARPTNTAIFDHRSSTSTSHRALQQMSKCRLACEAKHSRNTTNFTLLTRGYSHCQSRVRGGSQVFRVLSA